MACFLIPLWAIVATFMISEIHSATDDLDIVVQINSGWLEKDSGPILKTETDSLLRGSQIRTLVATHFGNGFPEGDSFKSPQEGKHWKLKHDRKIDPEKFDGIHKSRADIVRKVGSDSCEIETLTNGCSVPLGLPFFYKTQFTPSCNRHDICYSCGVGVGISRLECDLFFRINMQRTCNDAALSSNRLHPLENKATNEGSVQLRNQNLWTLIGKHAKVLDTIFEAEIKSLLKKEEKRSNDITASTIETNLPFLKRKVLSKWLLHLIPFVYRDNNSSLTIESDSFKTKARMVNNNISTEDGDQDLVETSYHRENYRFYTNILRSVVNASNDLSVRDLKQDILYHDFEALLCRFFAFIYYKAVRLFGGSHYYDVALDRCSCSEAVDCLPLQFSWKFGRRRSNTV